MVDLWSVVVPGKAPTSNARVCRAIKGHARWQRDFGLQALAQLRTQGLMQPLDGPVLCQVVERVPNARRDAGTGCKAILDALNGIAWRDDRQLVCHPPAIVDTDTAVAEVVVWFGDAHGSGVMRAWTLLVDAHLRQGLVG